MNLCASLLASALFIGLTFNSAAADTMSAIETAAQKGNADAQTKLGLAYKWGKGEPLDLVKAAYWFQKGADQGNPKAQYYLAVAYDIGWGRPKDVQQATYWYQKSADQGYGPAEYNIGQSYAMGDGVAKDYAKALFWIGRGALHGDMDSEWFLAKTYRWATLTNRDYVQSVYWNQAIADAGLGGPYNQVSEHYGIMLVLADEALGDAYGYGEGAPQNFTTAALWYQKSLDTDKAVTREHYAPDHLQFLAASSEAAFKLGILYADGLGVMADAAMAAKLYRRSADWGITGAQYNLGLLYERGEGVPQDFVSAYEWFTVAKVTSSGRSPYFSDATKAMENLMTRMTMDQIGRAQAAASAEYDRYRCRTGLILCTSAQTN